MLILRIRQAESALADGRLDEAYALARADDVRSHRRGQRLIGSLARALVSRGGEHLDADRPALAMADCVKAEKLAGALPEIATLRTDIAEAMSAARQSDGRRARTVAAAREHVENGRLSMGGELLAEMGPGSGRTESLRNELDTRRRTAEAALKRAGAAIDREDWAGAIEALAEAQRTHAANDRLADLTATVTEQVNQRIRAGIVSGRLDLAGLLHRQLTSLSDQNIETRELGRILSLCRQASRWVAENRPRRAGEMFGQLAAVVPDAAWVQDALDACRKAADGLETLRTGPVGLIGSGASRPAGGDEEPAQRVQHDPSKAQDKAGVAMPTHFMIHVDGAGSYLVLRDRRVTIGPDSSSNGPDLSLMAEPSMPQVAVERVDDDYFLTSSTPVRVNDRTTTRKLLAGGDRIALSRRCRVRFTVPHPASTSAVLDLSGTRLPKTDARRVILLDKNLVMGPAPSSHIRVDHLAEPVVLNVRDGRLFCKSTEAVTVNDRMMDRSAGIPLDGRVCVGATSFVVTSA